MAELPSKNSLDFHSPCNTTVNLLKTALIATFVLPAGNSLAGSGSSPGPFSAPLTGSSAHKTISGAPSGASVNGQAIPLCSHGGLCQGAVMRAIGRP